PPATLYRTPSTTSSSSRAKPPTVISTLSLHDALPISRHLRLAGPFGGAAVRARACGDPPHEEKRLRPDRPGRDSARTRGVSGVRSEEHTSELQSRENLVCRLLLEKKNRTNTVRGKCSS